MLPMRTTPPFRADHVGSLLRPASVLAARDDFAAGRITAQQLRAVEDGAIAGVVAMQQNAGLLSATDGEFRRASWHMDFIYQIGGIGKAPGNLAVRFHNPGGDGFFLEYDDERSGGFEPLRFVPPGKMVVLGLVTTKRGELEDPDTLKRRIDQASKFVSLDQLCLSPQCGFSSTVEGNVLSYEQEVAKLELIVKVAHDVWG